MVECAFSVPYNMNGLSFDVIIEILSNSMMKSSRANLSEGDELFTTDPTVNEKNRIYSCEEKEYFLKCVQEYHRKLFNTENDANTKDVLILVELGTFWVFVRQVQKKAFKLNSPRKLRTYETRSPFYASS